MPRAPKPSPLERLFFAGMHAEVLAKSIDSASDFDDRDTPFVVGALAFSGRIEEALAYFEAWLDAHGDDASNAVASRFFLGVGLSRAGRYDEADALFRDNLKSVGRGRDARDRFYVFQGLGCLRFFAGSVKRAAQHALRALHAAVHARFSYGRLLATDLRGHALVHAGEVNTGLRLLEQARSLAAGLDFAGHASALDCSIAIYRAHFGVLGPADAVKDLEAIASRVVAQDSYSKRMLLQQLALQLAFQGRAQDALEILRGLSSDAVPDGDARAKIRLLLVRATCARLTEGPAASRPFVEEAKRLLHPSRDGSLEVETLAAELAAWPERRRSVAARLRELAHVTGLGRARCYLELAEEGEAGGWLREMEEDRVGALFVAIAQQGAAVVERLVEEGYAGLVPLALGGEPTQRMIVLQRSERLLVEDRGNVSVWPIPSASSMTLLRTIAAGVATKEELVARVWKLTRYNPDKHDALVHTAMSRLRAALGTAGRWVEAFEGGYRTSPGVELVELDADRSGTIPPAHLTTELPPPMPPEVAPTIEGDAEPLLRHLRKHGPCSTPEIAKALGVSEMTAFRRILPLLKEGRLVRTGKARNTRYAIAVDTDAEVSS